MEEELHRLVRRFRGRVVWARGVRAVAEAGAGVAAVCLLAAVAQRVTGSALLVPTAMVGVCAGVVWVLVRGLRWPTAEAVALEIDRQCGLKELISSAVMAEGQDGFDRCVVAEAREAAKQVRAEKLDYGSMGTAAWVAMLLIGGLLPVVYRAPASEKREMGSDGVAGNETVDGSREGVQRRQTAEQAGDERRAEAGATPMDPGREGQEGATAAAARPTRSEMAGVSAGGGLAQSEGSTAAMLPTGVDSQQGERGMEGGVGGGRPDTSMTGTGSGGGLVTGNGSQAAEAVAGAGADVERDGTADAQKMPEAYRDVLKAYFAR